MSGAKPRHESTIAVLNALLAQGGDDPTQEKLSAASGLSARTVASVVGSLREQRLLGPRSMELSPSWGFVLAIALGAESCRAGLVDANGKLYCESSAAEIPGQTKLVPSELMARVASTARTVLENARSQPDLWVDGQLRLLGVSTAWPCPVRGSKRAAGRVLHPEWRRGEQIKLTEAVASAVGVHVDNSHAINDANAHGIAVSFDDARAAGMLPDAAASTISLTIRLGGGIGVSTMINAPHLRSRLSFIDSVLLGGSRSLAGELGHLPIDPNLVNDLNARSDWMIDELVPLSMEWPCSCGKSGHLESLAGGTAIARRLSESEIEFPSQLVGPRRLVGAAGEAVNTDLEDDRIKSALNDAGRLIGSALFNPVLLLDPHSLSLTGSFAVGHIADGIGSARENWQNVFGDALTIHTVHDDLSKYIGVRGAALAVIRSRIYRQLDRLVAHPEQLEEISFPAPY